LIATIKGNCDPASSERLAKHCQLAKVHAQDDNRLWFRVDPLTGLYETMKDNGSNERTAKGVAQYASSSEPGKVQFQLNKEPGFIPRIH